MALNAYDRNTLKNIFGRSWRRIVDEFTQSGGASLPDQSGHSGEYLTTDGSVTSWDSPAGSGDMLAATYDPTSVSGDAFDMDNMAEGATTKILTADERTKLTGIETGADVTDTANVTSAGALMDSEVDADLKTLSLPANTTISAFGASVVDDADAATVRTTISAAEASHTHTITDTFTWVISSPATGGVPGPRVPVNATVTRVDAYVTAATSATFNIEERGTIGSGGTDVLSTDMVADTNGESVISSFNNDSLAAGNWLWLDISAVSGTPGQLIATITFTLSV